MSEEDEFKKLKYIAKAFRNEINRNNEILKYIIYLILKSKDSLKKIVLNSGKAKSTIIDIGKILDVSICPYTKTFYLKDYEQRFQRG